MNARKERDKYIKEFKEHVKSKDVRIRDLESELQKKQVELEKTIKIVATSFMTQRGPGGYIAPPDIFRKLSKAAGISKDDIYPLDEEMLFLFSNEYPAEEKMLNFMFQKPNHQNQNQTQQQQQRNQDAEDVSSISISMKKDGRSHASSLPSIVKVQYGSNNGNTTSNNINNSAISFENFESQNQVNASPLLKVSRGVQVNLLAGVS